MKDPKSSANSPLFFSMCGVDEDEDEDEEVWWKLRSDRKAEELLPLISVRKFHRKQIDILLQIKTRETRMVLKGKSRSGFRQVLSKQCLNYWSQPLLALLYRNVFLCCSLSLVHHAGLRGFSVWLAFIFRVWTMRVFFSLSPSCLCMYTQDLQYDYVLFLSCEAGKKKRGSVVGKVLSGEGERLRKGPWQKGQRMAFRTLASLNSHLSLGPSLFLFTSFYKPVRWHMQRFYSGMEF